MHAYHCPIMKIMIHDIVTVSYDFATLIRTAATHMDAYHCPVKETIIYNDTMHYSTNEAFA